ncbi:MAG TPA: hypothetical protein VG895_01985 [Patescibacteria group bacterium]|nr:hypothetical protein [Patescibacteria group bacterium]
MNQKLDAPVSVVSYFDKNTLNFLPKTVIWNNRFYKINQIGLHHEYKKGDILYHIFSVTTDNLFLRLKFNTKSLNWFLEEISNGF